MFDMPLDPGSDPLFPSFTSATAFSAYEHVRDLMPNAVFPKQARRIASLADIADRFDVFVFDAYGVLNVGEKAIPGAVERVQALRRAGKACIVITNAASLDRQASFAKFADLAFHFAHEDIATSRQAAEEAVARHHGQWAVLGLDEGETGALPFQPVFPGENAEAHDSVDGFLFLSNRRWSAARQSLLEQSLRRRSRPVVIANPDIVAPQQSGLSTEPGYLGYRLARMGLGAVSFHGKPFPSVYDLVRQRHPEIAAGARVVMIGDTLHTDVLGGAAAGWSTVLVSDHGLFKGVDVDGPIAASGIVPDFITPMI